MRSIEGPPTPPTMRRPPPQARPALPTLLLGMALGMLLTLIIGGVVFGLGFLPIIEVQGAVAVCPPTPGFYPVCPTCPPTLEGLSATPEPPTATLDISATATAACSTFQSLFPGTPCP